MTTSAFIPDKYVLEAPAEWNDDVELDTSVFKSADASLHMMGTSNRQIVVYGDAIPVKEGDVVVGEWTLRQDDVTAGYVQTCYVFWFGADKWTYVASFQPFSAVLPAINTWYNISGSGTAPSGAYYARAVYIRASQYFDAWVDMMGVRQVPVSCSVYRNAAKSLSASTHTAIECETESGGTAFDYGGCYDSSTNYEFTAPEDGVYSLFGQVYVNNLPTGQMVYASLCNDSSTLLYYGPFMRNDSGSNQSTIAQVMVPNAFLSRGQKIRLRCYNSYSSTLTLTVGDRWTFFSAAKWT